MTEYPTITGLGFAVPMQVWDNHHLEKIVDTTDEWIRSRTGIVTRHIAGEKDTTASLGANAAWSALEDAGLDPLDVDIIIVATMTPEMPFPATACFIQDTIGAKNAAAFDISAACSGFIYGLSIGSSMIMSGVARNILIIGAETLSRIVDWTDRNTCVLFGDGAGAALLSLYGSGCKVVDTIIRSDGSNTNLLYMPGGGSRYPTSESTLQERMHYLKMTGKGLYKEATTSMADGVVSLLEKNGLSVHDMNLLVTHQANLRIIMSTAKKLKISSKKAYVNIDKYGNTSAATIPIALTEARDEGKIKNGDTVVLVGFGSGMTWGASLLLF